ncbi:hypothetical protein ACJIZ3_010885 [Penstemon smallii]|uniref:Uncharacterized protein n=1 Tax=Penstemon smallii TaxID=265156 RepID=A0ABD3ULS5_9LAMI
MSFLAGRLASTEGAYFFQESKQAVTRMLQNQKNTTPIISSSLSSSPPTAEASTAADVLPEVLRHSLPPKIFNSSSEISNTSSFSKSSKWVIPPDPNNKNRSFVSPDALNPLRAYVSLPQVTFGPKRWQIPNSENSIIPSTANDLREDKHITINPEKLKAAAAGLTQIGSAFAVATAFVFGGAALTFWLVVSKLEVHDANDVRTKGKDLFQPELEKFKEHLVPIRNRVCQNYSLVAYEFVMSCYLPRFLAGYRLRVCRRNGVGKGKNIRKRTTLL